MSTFTKFHFKDKKTITLDNKIIVPIPDELQVSTNSLLIGEQRKLVAIPFNYSFSEDFMEAPIGISAQCLDLQQKYDASISVDVYKMWFLRIGSFFDADVMLLTINPERDGVVFYQLNQSVNGDTTVYGLKWVGEKAYYLHVHFIGIKNFKPDVLLSIGVDWLNKVSIVNEKRQIFPMAFAFEKNYPHYNSMLESARNSLSGLTVVTNPNGTEYEFIPFKVAAANEDAPESMRAVYQRVIEKDTGKYTLLEKVKELQPLFHVNKSAFNSKHDRECEIEKGLLHRAYMMSALRSFAWTLAAYCEEKNTTPESVKADVLDGIVEFISGREWLNYNENSHCKGLCAGSDLHVYFIPDKVTQTDRKKLLPSKKELESDRRIKEAFSNYNPIHSEVHSLDELRKDLEYIYPAVRTLWEKMLKNRNYNEALTGNEADIVYAWCSLAHAAREPFFSEDGPMNCWHEQMDSVAPKKTKATGSKATATAKTGAESKKEASASNDKKGKSSAKFNFPEYEVKDSRKKFLKKSPGLRMPVHPDGCDIRLFNAYDKYVKNEEMELAYTTEELYLSEDDKKLRKHLFDKALQIADLFHVSDSEFDHRNDRESMIKNGYLKSVYQLHTFRSFAWTLTKWTKGNKKEVSDVNIEELIALADFIEAAGGTNYNSSSASDTAYCPSLRPKVELGKIYVGASGMLIVPAIKSGDECFIGSVGALPTSIKDLRKDLEMLEPAINLIYEYFSNRELEHEAFDSTLADILFAWGSFAYASREPFAVVEGPKKITLEREVGFKDDIIAAVVKADTNGFYIYEDTLIAIDKELCNIERLVIPEGVKRVLLEEQTSKYMDFNEHPDFYFLQNVKKLTVPSTVKTVGRFAECKKITEVTFSEGVEYIVDNAFFLCRDLEIIRFSSTIKRIGEWAFSSSENLKRATIPASLEEFGENAFAFVRGLSGPNSHHFSNGRKFDFVFEVYKDSYAEKYAKAKGWYHNVILTEEQKLENIRLVREERLRKEALRRAEQERIAEARRQEELRKLREEEERRRREAEERAKRVAHYRELLEEEKTLLQTIDGNKGLFGEKARKRKEAKRRLEEVRNELEDYKDLQESLT